MDRNQQQGMNRCPLIFGEVLFDQFDEDREVLGGAPFNVAWHLKGFGLDPLFISRIGDDRLGKIVLERMQQWNMDTAGVQTDATRPTGRVAVQISNNEPHYKILPDQAYDSINAVQVRSVLENSEISLIYHGTLALRDPESRNAFQILQELTTPVFVDVNLRPPWWKPEQVRQLLQGATWGKMNADELFVIAGEEKGANIQQTAESLCQDMGLQELIVTMGDQGAYHFSGEETVFAAAAPVSQLVDTVGAGDGFSAVCILGLIRGWEPSLMLQRAVTFAAEVVEQRGATSMDRMFYEKYKMRWTE